MKQVDKWTGKVGTWNCKEAHITVNVGENGKARISKSHGTGKALLEEFGPGTYLFEGSIMEKIFIDPVPAEGFFGSGENVREIQVKSIRNEFTVDVKFIPASEAPISEPDVFGAIVAAGKENDPVMLLLLDINAKLDALLSRE